MSQRKNSASVKQIAFTGLLFATALVLSFFESMLPVLPMMPPGIKLGLSNIVTMYALFVLGPQTGLTVAVLKSFFVFLTRGLVAASLSLAGGLTSIVCMVLLSKILHEQKNYLLLSIFGAIGHNVGQIVLARYILSTSKLLYLLPLLVLSGVAMGVVTGIVLRSVMPYIEKLKLNS